MTKRTNLAAALHEAGARPASAEATSAALLPSPAESLVGVSKRPPSRVGLRPVTAYVSPEVHRKLRIIGLERNLSVQELMLQAITEMIQRHEISPS